MPQNRNLVPIASALTLCALIGSAQASTFAVNDTGDTIDNNIGNGTCADSADSADSSNRCTLRAAIQEANALTGDPEMIAAVKELGAALF